MNKKIPYILDAKLLSSKSSSYEDWVKRNTCLINELITEAIRMLIKDENLKSVNIIELFMQNDVYTVMSLDRRGMSRAAIKVIDSWATIENYEKAAEMKDLLIKIENKDSF